MESEDTAEIKRLSEELTQQSHKLAEAMYQQASQAGEGQAGAEAGPEADAQTGGTRTAERAHRNSAAPRHLGATTATALASMLQPNNASTGSPSSATLKGRRDGETTQVAELLRYDRERAAELHRRDRVHTYGSFHIANLAAA